MKHKKVVFCKSYINCLNAQYSQSDVKTKKSPVVRATPTKKRQKQKHMYEQITKNSVELFKVN